MQNTNKQGWSNYGDTSSNFLKKKKKKLYYLILAIKKYVKFTIKSS